MSQPQCTAKSKRSGERCRNPPVKGRTTCRMHGGTAPVGPAASNWQGKGYSDYLPTRMRNRYLQAEQDGELLALRRDLAMIDARLVDVLNRVDSGESGHLWRQLQQAADDVERARRGNDADLITQTLNELLHLIRRGNLDYAAWEDVLKLVSHRQRLAESERKRLVQMQQMVTSEQAMGLVEALVESVRRHVHDEHALRAIAADVARLVGGRADPGADQASG